MTTLYYNLLYACNSACVFCASDNGEIRRGQMLLSDVLDSFKVFKLGPDDEVILNGGETTLFADIICVIESAATLGAHTTLFTNGRKLADSHFVRQLVDAGISRLTIPLYGRLPEEHDRLTGRAGSFRQTIAAIENAINLQREQQRPEIELKVLICRPCLSSNPELVDFIVAQFGPPSRFVLSGLVYSAAVQKRREKFVPDWDELAVCVNKTLVKAMSSAFNTILSSIPLCVLNDALLTSYLKQVQERHSKETKQSANYITDGDAWVYFDPSNPRGGIVKDPSTETKHFLCRNCLVAQFCTVNEEFIHQTPGAKPARLATYPM
ncbi:MAG: radical SAM protein [Anaerolineae bacterium]